MKTRDLENTLNNVHDQKSLTQYIQTIHDISYDSFHEYFNQLIQEKNLNRSEIIERSGIERTYCYHILNGTKNPSRDKILCPIENVITICSFDSGAFYNFTSVEIFFLYQLIEIFMK